MGGYIEVESGHKRVLFSGFIYRDRYTNRHSSLYLKTELPAIVFFGFTQVNQS